MSRKVVKDVKQSKDMKPEDCPHWSRCSAPFCPIENNSCEWFSNEEVCHRTDIKNRVVKRQKEIKRKSRKQIKLFEIADNKMRIKH